MKYDLLDLIRQYASQRYLHGIDIGAGRDTSPHESAATALLDRIAALLPQQPVQARDVRGALLWISENGGVVHHGQRPSGPWRPLLVGGDRGDDPAPRPDPLVLSLPKVPEDTVALVGIESGTRWTRYDGPLSVLSPEQWEDMRTGRVQALGYVLVDEGGSVRIESTPPREPRTWPRLDGAPGDLHAVRGASGNVYQRWAQNSAYYFPKRAMFKDAKLLSHWREVDGPLTEVLDDQG